MAVGNIRNIFNISSNIFASCGGNLRMTLLQMGPTLIGDRAKSILLAVNHTIIGSMLEHFIELLHAEDKLMVLIEVIYSSSFLK